MRGVDALGVLDSIDALLRPEDVAIEVDPAGKGFVTHRSFLGDSTFGRGSKRYPGSCRRPQRDGGRH